MSATSSEGRSRTVFAVCMVVAVLFLLYSILVANQVVVGISVLLFVFVFYLVYRFVRAHERIAEALEARTDRTGPNER